MGAPTRKGGCMKDDSGFLQDIVAHPNDPVPRLIYADWLDEQDDVRGEFLRLEVQLKDLKENDPQREKTRARLRALRKQIARTWLALLDRTDVENCGLQFEFKCPRHWEKLTPTDDATIRFCVGCQKNVYHCGSIGEARDRAQEGKCVAVDSRLTRRPGDIEPLIVRTLGKIAPPRLLQSSAEERREQREERRSGRRRRRRP